MLWALTIIATSTGNNHEPSVMKCQPGLVKLHPPPLAPGYFHTLWSPCLILPQCLALLASVDCSSSLLFDHSLIPGLPVFSSRFTGKALLVHSGPMCQADSCPRPFSIRSHSIGVLKSLLIHTEEKIKLNIHFVSWPHQIKHS